MLPFAIAFAILPGQASVRVSIPLALLVVAIAMGYATSDTFRNRRLDQYGIPRPKPVEEDEDEERRRRRAATPATTKPRTKTKTSDQTEASPSCGTSWRAASVSEPDSDG